MLGSLAGSPAIALGRWNVPAVTLKFCRAVAEPRSQCDRWDCTTSYRFADGFASRSARVITSRLDFGLAVAAAAALPDACALATVVMEAEATSAAAAKARDTKLDVMSSLPEVEESDLDP